MRAERAVGIADDGRRLVDLAEAVAHDHLAVGLADEDGDRQLLQLRRAFGRDLAHLGIGDSRRHVGRGHNDDALGAARIDRLCRRSGLAHEEACVGDLLRGRLVGGDDHAHAEPGELVELDGERVRQADATVRGRAAGDHARMHGDAGHGEALHERHRGAAVDVGIVGHLLVDDGEHPHRRRVAADPRRDDGGLEQAILVIDPQALAADGDDDLQRSVGLALWRGRHGFGPLARVGPGSRLGRGRGEQGSQRNRGQTQRQRTSAIGWRRWHCLSLEGDPSGSTPKHTSARPHARTTATALPSGYRRVARLPMRQRNGPAAELTSGV